MKWSTPFEDMKEKFIHADLISDFKLAISTTKRLFVYGEDLVLIKFADFNEMLPQLSVLNHFRLSDCSMEFTFLIVYKAKANLKS